MDVTTDTWLGVQRLYGPFGYTVLPNALWGHYFLFGIHSFIWYTSISVCHWKLFNNDPFVVSHDEFKGALCSFWGKKFQSNTLTEQTKSTNTHDWKKQNKLTLKDNTVSYCFPLFIWGGPCHLSSFKQCSRDLIFLWEQLVYNILLEVALLPH